MSHRASSTASTWARRFWFQPTTARLGEKEGATRACISTSSGRLPSRPAKTAAPDTASSRAPRKSAEGFSACRRPSAVISHTPISSEAPKRFL